MLGNPLFYAAVDELLSVVDRFGELMAAARVRHELVGGMAVFLHVRAVSEENARLTNDVDGAIRRSDLERIKRLAPITVSSSAMLPDEKPKAQSVSSCR